MVEKIEKIFKYRDASMIDNFKKSAVMILLCEEKGKTNIIFEVRSLKLRTQPGDICLPGGKVEERELPQHAAIRETSEELNIPIENIELIGTMDYIVTPHNFIIYPFVGKINETNINPNKDEVDHIFKVPIEFFMENLPMFHEIDIVAKPDENFPYHLIKNGKNYKFRSTKMAEYFYQYKDYNIWGFTALVIKRFIDIIKEQNI
ncbi:CoA pyrophosphatase [Clostridium sp. DJ247]|uniref:NUDIX hydrolase n=1 Tax=Clostridium sp. DJ247 TaxID=2726188 RepID=UPI001628F5BB|nr:CoA pyrophosphatase [Clostridium sp. DJ247]MBC2580119.1 CoA pyrophosphatase [Clostridium sp. DJ247]